MAKSENERLVYKAEGRRRIKKRKLLRLKKYTKSVKRKEYLAANDNDPFWDDEYYYG